MARQVIDVVRHARDEAVELILVHDRARAFVIDQRCRALQVTDQIRIAPAGVCRARDIGDAARLSSQRSANVLRLSITAVILIILKRLWVDTIDNDAARSTHMIRRGQRKVNT